jgi:CRISPR-associated endonuclease/helicase Cas3
VGNPFAAQGFSLYRGSVMGIWQELQQYDLPLPANAFADPWFMAYPTVEEHNADDASAETTVSWHEITDPDLLKASPVVVVNSAFCAYDAELGFRIVPPDQANHWQSTPGVFAAGNRPTGYSYQLETYTDHIRTMLALFARDFQSDYAYVQQRLAAAGLIPSDGLQQAIRLALAGHDIGKLDARWQQWVRLYQAAIGEPLVQPDYLAVHTHWDPSLPQHQQAKKKADQRVKRPHHAGEGALAVAHMAADLYRPPFSGLARAVVTAIARHHSPTTATCDDYALHPAASAAVTQALAAAGLVCVAGLLPKERGRDLDPILIRPAFSQQLLYLLIVRMLRLCDGLSQSSGPAEDIH